MSKEILRSTHELVEVLSEIFERTSKLLDLYVAKLILQRADWICSRELHISNVVKIEDDQLKFDELFALIPKEGDKALKYVKQLIVSYVQILEKLIPREQIQNLESVVSRLEADPNGEEVSE